MLAKSRAKLLKKETQTLAVSRACSQRSICNIASWIWSSLLLPLCSQRTGKGCAEELLQFYHSSFNSNTLSSRIQIGWTSERACSPGKTFISFFYVKKPCDLITYVFGKLCKVFLIEHRQAVMNYLHFLLLSAPIWVICWSYSLSYVLTFRRLVLWNRDRHFPYFFKITVSNVTELFSLAVF